MGLKQIGFNDTSVTGGYKKLDDSKKYRGVTDQEDFVVFATKPAEYRVHEVDNCVYKEEEEEWITFNTPCSKDWSESEEGWVGQCEWCKEGYPTKDRYILLLCKLAEKKGSRLQKIDPQNSTFYWDFAATMYEKLRGLNENTKGNLELRPISLKCTGAKFQKIDPNTTEREEIVEIWENNKKDYIQFAKDDKDLLELATAADPLNRQKKKIRQGKKIRRELEDNFDLSSAGHSSTSGGLDEDEEDDFLSDLDKEISDEDIESLLAGD